ncbi:Rhs family protein [Streptantibioticus cattleyicolor NRRL 8057 = DSM 46488]|uniref:Rhs family protein n=1 Tax=Streptantibioticus cattleyicolor (strain ATCC 35852 / DSM 46488 / JCM 4925 / NBRC 14057 / NRRL 8057) TaxID=1003195 RepID=F8K0E7_STREN|nr:Rhs family protein [Streptantibioticus cattleyicolor NRRL 8057 = DSM 46488]MYS61801.1 type IV secretion protein Rhs [Streptomyces sp. SID5468]CCB77674.1 protein of unknown function [Streptantibioticus cattleyicolor NRRL 8057 = DSM 46488]
MRLQQANTDGVVTAFAYDPAHRLVRATSPDTELVIDRDPLGRVLLETVGGHSVESRYDAVGHRTEQRLPSGAASRWEYGADDQPTVLHMTGHTLAFSYHQAGREIGCQVGATDITSQEWDALHRVASRTVRPGR